MESIQTQAITPEIIEQAMTYSEYRRLIDELLEEGKTTGEKQSESLTEYTKMNVHRMNRLDKQIELNKPLLNALGKVDQPWIWLVLTEGWCGDAAQNIPAINKMEESSGQIDLRLILRDEHPEIMDQYLTDGSRSIPKLICLDAETLDEIGTWGPRPAGIQRKAMQWKDDPEINKEEWAEKLHKKYAEDRTREIQKEFEELISNWQ